MNDRLKSINKSLKVLEENKKEINKSINKLEKEKNKILLENHKHIYRILCTPDRSNHIQYRTGYFSTFEKANHFIPEGKKYYDTDDNCHWTYSVVVEKSTGWAMKQLDNPPEDVGYCGW